MNRDRVALYVAYLILVCVTAWSSYATDRHVRENRDTMCIVGVAAIAIAEAEAIGSDPNDEQIALLVDAIEIVADECGDVEELQPDSSE